MRRLPPLIAAGIVAAVVAVASVEAGRQLVVPRNSVGTQQIRNGAILPADLNRATVAWLNAGAPAPRGRGVTVANGQHGDRVRVTAATMSGGNVLGQAEYLGGLTCPNYGPTLRADGTFFDAAGVVSATGSWAETEPVVGVRYPLQMYGKAGSVRAEVVTSIGCF